MWFALERRSVSPERFVSAMGHLCHGDEQVSAGRV